MILSHTHRFIFIKTVKTAGTSLEVLLADACGPDDIVTPVWPPEPGHTARNYHGGFNPLADLTTLGLSRAPGIARRLAGRLRFYNHMPASLVRQRVGADTWRAYTSFTIERNPWDKTLSHFHMLNARRRTPMTLDAYIERGRFPPGKALYCDRDNRWLVDRVLRFETLQADLADLAASLGLPIDPAALPRAKGGYRQDRRPAAEVLTPAQANRVAEHFAYEIAWFGYTLDGARGGS